MRRSRIIQAPRAVAGLLTEPLAVTEGLRIRRETYGRRGQETGAERGSRTGFTLVEMLVSVTLVLLMMVMFGEIFQLASDSVTKQRVMADNDQNVRNFATILREDLKSRTFRNVVPFYPNESVDVGIPFDPRRGYFSISTNDPLSGTDDVLQFTVESADGDLARYYFGRAIPFLSLLSHPNQPERDDLQLTSNASGMARAAEVSYWLRGGNLYRRVMLIRSPLEGSGGDPAEPYQPATNTRLDYFRASSAPPYTGTPQYTGNLWGDFDYSVHRLPTPFVVAPLTAPYAIFNGAYDDSGQVDYLANDKLPLTGAPGSWTASLGQTWNRFGHNHDIQPGPTGVFNGLPREFSARTAPNFFFGRFTHAETSDANFRYPHLPAIGLAPPGNPMDGDTTATPANTLQDANGDGVVDQFANGNRVGVDLMMTHVHEFRVELWDDRLNDFAAVGHSRTDTAGIAGDYHFSRRLNTTYGPLGGTSNVFDTWHPRFDRDNNGAVGNEPDRPPFRPVIIDPTGISGIIPTNPSGASLFWAPNTIYQIGDIVFPRMEDRNGNGFLDPGEDGVNGFPSNGVLDRRLTEDANGNNMLDPGEDGTNGFPADGRLNSTNPPYFPFGMANAYRCIRGGRSGPWSNNEPAGAPPNWGEAGQWSRERIRGRRAPDEDDFGNDNGFFDPWEDTNGNGTNDVLPDEPDWEPLTLGSSDTLGQYGGNVRPLRAIRITIRFEHPTSKQMKQVTIVQSLRDTASP